MIHLNLSIMTKSSFPNDFREIYNRSNKPNQNQPIRTQQLTQTLTTVHNGRQAREQLKHLKTVETQMLALLALLQTDAFDC